MPRMIWIMKGALFDDAIPNEQNICIPVSAQSRHYIAWYYISVDVRLMMEYITHLCIEGALWSSLVVSVDIIVVICPTLCIIRARPLSRSAFRKIAPMSCAR